ncbi:MAG: DUF5686 and carboxypeptidase regulatory-like domain-containing protein [Bacteroidota bacterium]
MREKTFPYGKELISILFYFFQSFIIAQSTIKGHVKGSDDVSLAFATVYIKGTTIGTTANAAGYYQLKIPAGKHTIVAQYVGYQTQEVEIEIRLNEIIQIDFVLAEQAITLKEVVVSASDNDPADRIIREAIKKREFYEKEVRAFKCKTYLKGLQRLDEKPDKILGIKVTTDTGIVYLSESVSEFRFELPDKVSETMLSSKVSGNEQGFSFNQASDFNINLYQKNFYFDGLSERSFVSPISPRAFLFYDYELVGYYQEEDEIINKILLKPKRKTDPVFSGHIYIAEDSWRIQTVALELVKSRGIEFIDSVKINQTLAPVEDEIWMPISQRFEFQFQVFGFKGSGYFVGVYSDYELEPNYEIFRKYGVYQERFTNEKQEKDLFKKKDFSTEVLTVTEGSNKKDSIYWRDIRPMPLTPLEVADYEVKDSIRIVKESDYYKDSVDHERNQLTAGNLFLSGYTRFNSISNRYWNMPPLISIFQYNTVEGFVPEIAPTFWTQENNRTKYWIRPSIRYGFSDERFKAKLESNYRLLDTKDTRFQAGAGKYVFQFDEREPISPFINSYITLVNGENFMKLFSKSFGYFRFQQEISNGILFNGTIEYASRDTLANSNTSYSWTREENENFTSNRPINEELSNTAFTQNQSLSVELNFRFRFKQQYAMRPDRKINYPSKYPELMVSYKKGIPVAGSDINYDFLKATVTDDIRIGLLGTSQYAVEVGGFLTSKELTFVDFHHFTGNRTSFRGLEGIQSFQLLDYYAFSTAERYAEAHYEHHFNEFIFNKIPLIRKLNLQAVVTGNFLYTPTLGDYVELGVGIEHIFSILRVDYFWAYREGEFAGRGLRIGAGF